MSTVQSTPSVKDKPLISLNSIINLLAIFGVLGLASAVYYNKLVVMTGFVCLLVSFLLSVVVDVFMKRESRRMRNIFFWLIVGFLWAALLTPLCAC